MIIIIHPKNNDSNSLLYIYGNQQILKINIFNKIKSLNEHEWMNDTVKMFFVVNDDVDDKRECKQW